jgi:D-alanyl-lipoteichoic acid acyltransferase DltB (MBOAT superfamily)
MSPYFFVAVFVGLIVTRFLLPARRTAGVWLFLSLALILEAVGLQRWYALWPIGVFLSFGFGAIHLVRLLRRGWILGVTIALTVVLFMYLKRYVFFQGIWFPSIAFTTVGMSYIFFRVIHLIVDYSGDSEEKPPSLGMYLAYNCSFLSFLSGPIQRYPAFVEDMVNPETPTRHDTYAAFTRIVDGYLKVVVLSALFQDAHNYCLRKGHIVISGVQAKGSPAMMAAFSLAAVLYMAFLYVNFSGYVDVVVGFGRLFGMRLPENFSKPFQSPSFVDFWSRWHITLSEWFRDYVFNPLLKALSYRLPPKSNAIAVGLFSTFVTFFLMGIWHGTTLTYVTYGLFLASGITINRIYDLLLRRYVERSKLRKMRKSDSYLFMARCLTQSYFALGLTCLWCPDGITHFVGELGLVRLLSGAAGVVLCLASVQFSASACSRATARMRKMWARWQETEFVIQLQLAGKAFLLSAFWISSASGAPEFVYKAF